MLKIELKDEERTRCEVWKDVKGYDGKYQVSNLGRFKRLESKDNMGRIKKEIIINPKKLSNGYFQFDLWLDGKRSVKSLHKLLFETFNQEIPKNSVVHHKNHNKNDNSLSNLCLMSYSKHNKHHKRKIWNKGLFYGETEAYKKSNKSRRGNYIKDCLSMMKEFYKNEISVKEFSKLKNITTRTFYERKKFLCSLVQY